MDSISSINDESAFLGSSCLSIIEWNYVATKFLIELVKDMIESFDKAVFKQQNWKNIREQILKEHQSEAIRTWI